MQNPFQTPCSGHAPPPGRIQQPEAAGPTPHPGLRSRGPTDSLRRLARHRSRLRSRLRGHDHRESPGTRRPCPLRIRTFAPKDWILFQAQRRLASIQVPMHRDRPSPRGHFDSIAHPLAAIRRSEAIRSQEFPRSAFDRFPSLQPCSRLPWSRLDDH